MSAETEKAQNPAKRRLLVMLPLLLFTGLALVFLLQLFAGDPSKLPSALIGKKVPEFSLPAVEGLEGVETFDSKALEGPGVKLVNFWASWCPPCRVEHPFLMELAKRDDLQVLGINQKDQAENARRFLGLHGNPYAKVGADPKGRVSIDWGVYGLPETFVIDAKGNIRFKYVGPITQDVLQTLLPEIEKAKQPL